MDDWTKYGAFRIPQRETSAANEETPPVRTGGSVAPVAADSRFAEIEVEANPNPNQNTAHDAARRFFSSVTPPQTIAQRTVDPIRQKFYDMRSLAGRNPFARDDAVLFYKQAKFMEGFADNYDGNAPIQMYFPYYQHMSYEQLRTYFTWRTKVRQGEILPTSVSYAFLYVYELLSCIGADNYIDGLNKLVEIWDKFLKYGPALLNYLPQWFKDYHVYYDLPHSFTDFVEEHNLRRYFPETFMFDPDTENSLEIWNCVSSCNVTGSKFYTSGYEQQMKDCFRYVLDGIIELCRSLEINCGNLFVYRHSRVGVWYPFKKALFYPWRRQPDRQVNMPGQERYQCKNNRWSANLPIYYSSQKEVVGSILKKTESCLRKAVKFKYQLKAEPCIFYRSSSTPIEFDGVIEKAVADYYRDLTRTVVTVDHTNLARIREEALGTQDKLIVTEENSEFGIRNSELGDGETGENSECGIRNSELGDEGTMGDSGVDFGWLDFRKALSDTELMALSIALRGGGTGIKTFADDNGIMLEVLADSINEKAADFIGDNILELDELGMVIYDEYKSQVEELKS